MKVIQIDLENLGRDFDFEDFVTMIRHSNLSDDELITLIKIMDTEILDNAVASAKLAMYFVETLASYHVVV